MADRRESGRVGEDAACKYMTGMGYQALSRNFRYGRYGEIDLVMQKSGVICFIEVKSRTSDRFGTPAESVGYAKRRKILTVANHFLKLNDAFGQKVRFDIIEIYYAADGSSVSEIRHIENAFGDNWA